MTVNPFPLAVATTWVVGTSAAWGFGLGPLPALALGSGMALVSGLVLAAARSTPRLAASFRSPIGMGLLALAFAALGVVFLSLDVERARPNAAMVFVCAAIYAAISVSSRRAGSRG